MCSRKHWVSWASRTRGKMQRPTVNIENQEIGPYLVGDSAYPLTQWLQKPYPEGTRDPEEKAFNRAVSGHYLLLVLWLSVHLAF